MKKIGIIDIGSGNLHSLMRCLRYLDVHYEIIDDPDKLDGTDAAIIPGVGSFHQGINSIKKLNLLDALIKYKSSGKGILGICLGMQLFGNYGYENNLKTEGLNLISGEIKKIPTDFKLPHIGWNEVKFTKKDKVLNKIKNNKDFYFVHSYYFACSDDNDILGTTYYDFKFPSIIKKNNVYGFQFHPEKSLNNGLNLLNNFLNI